MDFVVGMCQESIGCSRSPQVLVKIYLQGHDERMKVCAHMEWGLPSEKPRVSLTTPLLRNWEQGLENNLVCSQS